MPYFQFEKGMRCDEMFLTLVATMVHIDDEYKRKEYVKVTQYKSAIEAFRAKGIDPFVGADAVDYRPYPLLSKEFTEYSFHGYAAGKILLLLYWMHETNKTMSLNKAFDMTLSISIRAELSNIGLSRTSLKAYWKKYRNISHYFAASKIALCGSRDRDEICCEELLSNILNIGEYFRVFGETHFIGKDHTRRTVLDGKQSWQLPDFLTASPPEDIPFELDPEHLLEKIYARAAA